MEISEEYVKKLEAEISRLESYIHDNDVATWKHEVPETPGWYFTSEQVMVKIYMNVNGEKRLLECSPGMDYEPEKLMVYYRKH